MKDSEYIGRITKYSEKIARYMSSVNTLDEFYDLEEKVDAVIANIEQMRQKKSIVELNGQKLLGLEI